MSHSAGLLGSLYSDPPDLVLIDLTTDIQKQKKIVSTLRSDSFFSSIPILGIVDTVDEENFQWDRWAIDDFVRLPFSYNEFFCRISLSITRIKRVFDNNPLTRLPGNTSIQRAIEDALGKPLLSVTSISIISSRTMTYSASTMAMRSYGCLDGLYSIPSGMRVEDSAGISEGTTSSSSFQ